MPDGERGTKVFVIDMVACKRTTTLVNQNFGKNSNATLTTMAEPGGKMRNRFLRDSTRSKKFGFFVVVDSIQMQYKKMANSSSSTLFIVVQMWVQMIFGSYTRRIRDDITYA